MEKNNFPKTSLQAYDSVKASDMREGHYMKIKKALEHIVWGNYEQIADAADLEKHQVNRRLSEMFRLEMVFKAGYTLPTSTGRQAEVYQLVKPEAETENKPIEGKTITDFSKALVQTDLFGNLTEK